MSEVKSRGRVGAILSITNPLISTGGQSEPFLVLYLSRYFYQPFLFQGWYEDIDGMARYLMALNLPFVVRQPTELRDALLRLAEQMVQRARSYDQASHFKS